MIKRAPLNQDEIGTLLALAAILFGGWLRIYPVWQADFPINDGGLFYVMTRAIQENSFHLPFYVSYNALHIPFAYPPLAFYVTAALGKVLNIPLIFFFRFLPAVVLIGTITAFYPLAKTFLKSRLEAGIATLIFALTPRSVTWFIMGGGLTRSFGLLFLILASTYVYRAFLARGNKDIILASLFSTLLVLSHPEAALHMIGIGLLFLIFKARDKRGIIIAATIVLSVIFLSSIWWITVLLRFGLTPALSAAQTGLNEPFGLLYPFVQFSEEPYVTFIMVFAFLGITVRLIKREYLLPAWYILPFLIEMRSARNVAIVPLALLATIGLIEIFKLFTNLESQLIKREIENPLQSRATTTFLIFFTIYSIVGMQLHGMKLSTQIVTKSNRMAFEWIVNNIPPSSRFLVITGETELLRDWTQEWFPALTERISLTTIQGREWLNENDFETLIENFQYIQSCANSEALINCISEGTRRANMNYDFIYIAKVTANIPLKYEPKAAGFVADLKRSKNFMLVYDSTDVVILKRLAQP